MHDADKLLDIFCYDNKQRKPYEIIYGLRITFNDHAFIEDQKAEPKATCLAEISELWKISPPYNLSQVTLNLNLFLVSMLLQKQRYLCHWVPYILYLQYNKQWYQMTNCLLNLMSNFSSFWNCSLSNFVHLHLLVLLNWTVQSKLFLN